jgi:molybdopterin/thiamine biosynthesis adenylyltransferase
MKIYEQAVSLDKRLSKPMNNKWDTDIISILFPEETQWRGERDGWMFLCKTTKQNRFSLRLARGGRAGRADLQGRNPALHGIENKKVAVFGLGCLGAPSALEFAKCGMGELRLLDNDYIEPGTVVRWPFGLQTAAGRDKSTLIANMIAADYPFTKVTYALCRLGRAQWTPERDNGLSEKAILANLIDGADLIYDATAEVTVNRVLSNIAAESGIPYIQVAGTPGMWGGRVVRIRPGEGRGCWSCYRHATMEGDIPSPIADEVNGLVAPEGCSAPTFSGTAFDASEISMAGVRLAISTLMENIEGGYPSIDWDVAVINLRSENGAVIPPQWSIHQLSKHPKCNCR